MEVFIERRSKSFFNKSYMKADYFIVLSSDFKNKLQAWGVKSPIQVLTTAVDDALLSGFSIDQKVSRMQRSEKIKILFLSRVEKAKGIFETIEAVRLLLAHGHRVSLTIAGVGSASDEVRRYLNQRPALRDRIDILGYVRDAQKRRVLHDNDILSLPTSHHEGLPAAVLEAMACGMPVLTRPVGGITDFFEHGKMGLLLRDATPAVIAQGLSELIQDKRGRMAIARRNHHYALDHFLASKSARDLTAVYRHLLCPNATLRRS